MSRITLVAKREYLKVIRKWSFWAATLSFPLLFAIIAGISAFSSSQSADILKKQSENAKEILVLDEANVVSREFIKAPFKLVSTRDNGIDAVKSGKADAFFYYPRDLSQNGKVEIVLQDKGVFSNFRYNDVATSLIKQSILGDIKDSNKLSIFNKNISQEVRSFKNGVETNNGLEKLIIPGLGVAIYFMLISFASSYLLLSVSEEKENRVMETVLTIVKPRELIWGKILGQIAIVFTQWLALIALMLVVYLVIKPPIPLDFAKVTVTPIQVIASLSYTVIGFLIMACIMVGVGAAMPSYKEASSFSSVFILFSILPIYLVSLIVADPNGIVAMITSYFPLTAAMVLLFRNALGELSILEFIISTVVLIGWVMFFFWTAYKLFEIGSIEYSKKISLKQLFGKR